jgi:hypothetical protein
MFTRIEYIRLSTALPIIAPIPLFVIGVVLAMLRINVPDWIFFAINISFGAMFMFGIPYCILVCVLLFVVWERPLKTHIVAALAAPVLMIPVVRRLSVVSAREESRSLGAGVCTVLSRCRIWLCRNCFTRAVAARSDRSA